MYDKCIPGSKVETFMIKNEMLVHSKATSGTSGNNMDLTIVLKDRKKTKFFIGLSRSSLRLYLLFLVLPIHVTVVEQL